MRFARATSRIVTMFAFAAIANIAANAQDTKQTVLAHYMPWYASKPVSGEWGWHWTMNRFNPETIKDGEHEIASHDSPLIGPYDSGDDLALECQVLLMKLAGLDGVVIDWYGTADFRDYAMIHRNARRLIVQLRKAGLQYAICYEDQTVKHMVEDGYLQEIEAAAEGMRAIKWLADNCFGDPSYVKLNNRPVLLVFGPQHFTKVQFRAITSGISARPKLFGLPHLSQDTGMDGAFGWPPVSGGLEITRDRWAGYLNELHAQEAAISVVFPAFRDIYEEAGLHPSYGYIDGRDGKTFAETLDMAFRSRSKIIQIATWNDYGEGTMIEPTVENGYRYLEALQDALGARNRFAAEDLRLPVTLYELQKKHSQDPDRMRQLKYASACLFAGKCQAARNVFNSLQQNGKSGNCH